MSQYKFSELLFSNSDLYLTTCLCLDPTKFQSLMSKFVQ